MAVMGYGDLTPAIVDRPDLSNLQIALEAPERKAARIRARPSGKSAIVFIQRVHETARPATIRRG